MEEMLSTTPSGTGRELYRDICRFPFDTDLRSIFADWLQQQNDRICEFWGALIAAEMSTLFKGRARILLIPGNEEIRRLNWWHPGWGSFQKRTGKAGLVLTERRSSGSSGVLAAPLRRVTVRHGFVCSLRIPLREWLQSGTELVQRWPLTALRLQDPGGPYRPADWDISRLNDARSEVGFPPLPVPPPRR